MVYKQKVPKRVCLFSLLVMCQTSATVLKNHQQHNNLTKFFGRHLIRSEINLILIDRVTIPANKHILKNYLITYI